MCAQWTSREREERVEGVGGGRGGRWLRRCRLDWAAERSSSRSCGEGRRRERRAADESTPPDREHRILRRGSGGMVMEGREGGRGSEEGKRGDRR
jgi:hypothetical protein